MADEDNFYEQLTPESIAGHSQSPFQHSQLSLAISDSQGSNMSEKRKFDDISLNIDSLSPTSSFGQKVPRHDQILDPSYENVSCWVKNVTEKDFEKCPLDILESLCYKLGC